MMSGSVRRVLFSSTGSHSSGDTLGRHVINNLGSEDSGDDTKELKITRKVKDQQHPLHNSIQRAILENDAKRLTKLLGQRVKLRLTPEDLALSLMEAISQGKAECIPPLLEAKADPNCVDEDGKTPMIVCMESKAGGSPIILRDLLKAGASPNKATWSTQQTALHVAARKGYQVAVKVLLSFRARVDKEDMLGNTPLMYAAREGHYTAVKMLLEAGAHPDPVNKQFETPLLFAAKAGHQDCAGELLDHGANPDNRDSKGQTALLLALKGNHTGMIELLMSYNCDVNTQNVQTGKTILHLAVENGDLKLVQTVLRMGAEPNIRDKEWETPFITALLSKRMDILNMLIQFKCKITVTDKHFNTGLHLAAREGLSQLIPMFLKAGLDCNLKTSTGQTPLMLAASGGHVDIISSLLGEGANPDAMDRHRATPMVYAIMSKASDAAVNSIIKILIRTGCNIDQPVTLLKFLKENKIEPSIRNCNVDNRPYLPLEVAFLRGRPLVFLMLLKAGSSLRDFNQDILKHGQDILSPKRTEFRTVLYLLKNVKSQKKHFPTLRELCRKPAARIFKDPYFQAHVNAIHPPRDVTSYLEFTDLDDLEKTFTRTIATFHESSKNTGTGPTNTRSSDSSAFSRLSNIRSTYTLGSSQRRRTTTNASNNSRMSSASSEDDDVFRSGGISVTRKIPTNLQNGVHQRSRTLSGQPRRLNDSDSSHESGEHQNGVTEKWVIAQNHKSPGSQVVQSPFNRRKIASATQSPYTSRKTPPVVHSPTMNRKANSTPNRRIGGPRLNTPRKRPTLESMLFASPAADPEPSNNLGYIVSSNRDSLISNDTGFHSEDTPRCESPTERDLRGMKSAMVWQHYTSPYDSWDNESIDSAGVGSIGSRETDTSDFSRESNSNGVNDKRFPNKPASLNRMLQPLTNGTPTLERKSKIPTLRKPVPSRSNTDDHLMLSSQFVDADDDGPGRFIRSKSCRKY